MFVGLFVYCPAAGTIVSPDRLIERDHRLIRQRCAELAEGLH
ncbi:MAG TPA: hypothetical protein VI776_12240 [Anaerolineales bacterium]|jgi:hypothetical protein|nr:hypothetical protein [Anaerolineales bacterium]